ncbi:protein containing GGDEF domain [Sulfurimonas gotlandica GD1]|uniref:Protein containing GGDEF domain n=1 Tax=Sulfurimonas gotlandica (strain DSM 19862 / JCM 16533 / GD1) TaxID=929558 RepID=B6BLK2_SULGG|nr:GGDEF domain-containing protein [Sulfurimonas gotlandica]EDZ62078.1 GGDEF domain protein [Sulfurimonas gotlandica GD1]EHP28659.1 protein containing GGDEF domain [Sulfurimonas gotlandica GD1]
MSKLQELAPNLLNIIDQLEINRVKLGSEWIEIPTVKSIFKNYKIAGVKFRDGYGVPIIEYFIAVVREEKEAGNCPIMSKLVNFLLEKNITPKDVFDICMGLRRTLVTYIFRDKLIKDNAMEMMDEIAILFDANLSGVLEIFTTFYEKKQQAIQKSIVQQKKFSQILKIINFINTKIIIVQNGHIILANQPFFEAIGVNDIKEFNKNFSSTFSFMKDVDSSSKIKFDLENINEWLSSVYESNKPFTTNIFNNKMADVFTYSGRITTLPESEPTKYIISFNSISSHVANEALIREKLEHDELTGLYNYVKFIHLMGEAQRKALQDNTQLALVIVDIPQLKEINNTQGMDAGDKAIVNVAKDLISNTDKNMIVARLEGSRFGVLIVYENEQDSYNWCSSLHIELSKSPHRKTISITAFDLSETVNSVQIRANSLIDEINSSQEGSVSTDFENVKLYEALPDQERFTDRLKGMKKIKTTLYYKGLAISVENKLLFVDKDSATVQLSNKEFCATAPNENIYLEFPMLGIVKASVYSLNDKNNTVKIHRFRLSKHTPLKRKIFRVEVEENMKVNILSDGPDCEGVVNDINEEYIGLRLKRKRSLDEGSFVSIDIMLPVDDITTSFITEATVKKIEKVKDGFKIVVLCHLDGINKGILKQYIANRQMKIIHELRK